MKYIKQFFVWAFSEKCELCHGSLRRGGDMYYGGIEVKDTISGSRKRTAYVCNLCYQLHK